MASSLSDVTALASKLYLNDDADESSANNIFAGGIRVHVVDIHNSASSTAAYVKMANATSATPGTTPADLVLFCPANTRMTYNFIAATGTGLYFNDGISMWCTTTKNESNTTGPATNAVYVKVLGQ